MEIRRSRKDGIIISKEEGTKEIQKVESEVSLMHRLPAFPGKESPFYTRLTGPQIRSGNKEFPAPFYTYDIVAGIAQSVYLLAGWPGFDS
jgi:hypothetical protein